MNKPPMPMLCFLQNQWFKDPARMEKIYAKHHGYDAMEHRAYLNGAYLFMGCLTGKRLRDAFGESFIHDSVIWENASPKMASEANGSFPADREHMQRCIDFWQPRVVLALGVSACSAVAAFETPNAKWKTVVGPHPAARAAGTILALSGAAALVKRILEGT